MTPHIVTVMLHAASLHGPVLGGSGPCQPQPHSKASYEFSCLPDLLWRVFLPFQEMKKGYSNNLSDGESGGKAESPAFSLQKMHVVNSTGEENFPPGPQRQSLGMS